MQILVTAGLVDHKKIACYEHVKFEVEACGGIYVTPQEAVMDGRIVTGKTWQSHPEFYRLVFSCLQNTDEKTADAAELLEHVMNVYKHYNQEQLNDQYNTRLQVPDYAVYFDRWERLSRQTAEDHTILKDIPYGDHPKERLDIFPSKIPHSKTLVFIHGGYWHLLDKSMFHFLAGHFLKYNVTTVLMNYPLAP